MRLLHHSALRASCTVVAALLLLAACDRKADGAGSGATPAASAAAPAASAASAPASAASQPASAAQAPPLVPQQVPVASAADPQLVSTGQQLATQGAGQAAACVTCHGANGEGNAQSGFPRLAGQGKLYLAHQLDSYANGSRKSPVMQPIATALSESQRQAAAAYYASLGSPSSAAQAASAPPASLAGRPTATGRPPAPGREPVLAAVGDNARQLQGCVNCHGPQGIGDAAATPYLAGQHASYLTAAMAAWKSGDRNNDPSGQMPQIARTLNDAEVKALVAYYSTLPPPAPRNAQAAPPPVSAGRASVQSGPVAQTAPLQGTGSEQGSGITGGSQGQGVGGAATNQSQTPGQPAAAASGAAPAASR